MSTGLDALGVGWEVVEANVIHFEMTVSWSDDTIASRDRLRTVCNCLTNYDRIS